MKRRRQGKYRNKKCVIDGITFASEMEGHYYQHLRLLQKSGEVESFTLQPRFQLQPSFKKHGKTWRAMEYVSDFAVRWADGREDVRDVKGKPTREFRLKQKIYTYRFDVPLILVTEDRGTWREWV